MKKKEWMQAMNLADEQYVEEADPSKPIVFQKKNRHRLGILVACLCGFFIISSLILFVPFNTAPPDVSQYKDSEYYPLIQKLNLLTFDKPKYKNNFEKFVAGFSEMFFNFKDKSNLATGENSYNEEKYQEITDNQVDGIIEGDRIKRSDRYIYYLDNNMLKVFSIAQESTELVASFDLLDDAYILDFNRSEFYLSSDCKTITVIASGYRYRDEKRACVVIISLDVSDPSNIQKKDTVSITGSYLSSRMTSDSLLLLTQFNIEKNTLDFSKEETFLPQIDQGNGMKCISADGIISPETLTDSRYTVVLKLDENTLEVEGAAAYLSYSQEVYVSAENVFAIHSYAEKTTKNNTTTSKAMTEISCLSYAGDTFENRGSFTLEGHIKNQYSLDEYKGILRVVTTTSITTVSEQRHNGLVSAEISVPRNQTANLYCVDLKDLQIVSEVLAFAPQGERVQSVRFDGNSAYVCTSIELTDPVFFFDLSDISHITYKDTGTIDGFSSSLVNFGNGYLLGIGRGDRWDTFKVEIYEESADGVRSVCKYELERATYSDDYKSYYIDRQNQMIGIGIDYDSYSENNNQLTQRYLLLMFDGYELHELVNVPLDGGAQFKRAVYIDGYLYLFGWNDFTVEKVF